MPAALALTWASTGSNDFYTASNWVLTGTHTAAGRAPMANDSVTFDGAWSNVNCTDLGVLQLPPPGAPLDTRLLEASGNVPGELLNGLFLSLMPVRLTQHKYVRLLLGSPDARAIEHFVRMEKWIFDSPPQAGLALAQFVRWFYQENRFVTGTLLLGGRPVRLTEIRMPVLNLYAREDHIVPPAACAALAKYVGSAHYSDLAVATGHIGMYVSRAAREEIPARITSWLSEPERLAPRRSRRASRG